MAVGEEGAERREAELGPAAAETASSGGTVCSGPFFAASLLCSPFLICSRVSAAGGGLTGVVVAGGAGGAPPLTVGGGGARRGMRGARVAEGRSR